MTTSYQYVTDKLGAAPADDTLRQLPINCNTSGHPSGGADVRCWPHSVIWLRCRIWSRHNGDGRTCRWLERSRMTRNSPN
jgi:hypothetical protein